MGIAVRLFFLIRVLIVNDVLKNSSILVFIFLNLLQLLLYHFGFSSSVLAFILLLSSYYLISTTTLSNSRELNYLLNINGVIKSEQKFSRFLLVSVLQAILYISCYLLFLKVYGEGAHFFIILFLAITIIYNLIFKLTHFLILTLSFLLTILVFSWSVFAFGVSLFFFFLVIQAIIYLIFIKYLWT